MEPVPLVKIISEEEFLPLVQESSTFFFKIYNSFAARFENNGKISRKFYSNLIQEAEIFECFLDEYGARENRRWNFFTEYVACIRNLGLSAFFIKHLLERFPYYNIREVKDIGEQFCADAQKALSFLNRSLFSIYQEVLCAGRANGLAIPTELLPPHEFSDIKSNKRLPRNISEDQVKDIEERIIDLCEKVQKVSGMMDKIKIKPTEDLEALKKLIPRKIDEKRSRMFKELVHSVQSDYDTYIHNTHLEQEHPDFKNLRGHVSISLHLLETELWLCHFYERHEDEIRRGECKSKISELVDKGELLRQIINFGFFYSFHFIREGSKLADSLLGQFVKTTRIEVPIPQPLGFHARPCTYISLIAREHGEDLFLIVDGEKYNAKSVMSLLQAGGAISDKGCQKVIFEGSKRVLNDVKILARYNYCEEKDLPKKLGYLRVLRNTA
ncbi:MAG: HPr family phosphocarrier protein [Nitrospinaceae bacterium]